MTRFDRPTLDRFLAELGRRLDGFTPEIPPPAVDPAARAIIWVVGTPRSGTTLMAETLAAATNVGFVDNLAARFPRQPAVGMLLSAAMRPPVAGGESVRDAPAGPGAPGDAEFDIGRTPGLHGTHEFGFFWTHWLGLDAARPHRLDAARRAAIDGPGLQAQLRSMISVADRPLLVRNVICGLNAALLARLHPRSVFVEVRRNPRDTAASILTCRRRHAGGAHRWWSLRPSTWRAEGTDPAQSALPDTGDGPNALAAAAVARQVLDIRADLRDEVARLAREGSPAPRWRQVRYEDLCRTPAAVLAAIAEDVHAVGDRLRIHDGSIGVREVRPAPAGHAGELAAIEAVLSGAIESEPPPAV